LTGSDREQLAFIAEHADLLGLSYVQCVGELTATLDALEAHEKRGPGKRPGLVLKIETRQAFSELPQMLLSALGRRPLGVMIARGDLALEVGFERLAEVQEELLWLCEAAHVPVIWATAVLERLAKRGLPTRAEVTDAAMSERAECVMLNKGEHIVEAVAFLDGILKRMEAHQRKKSARLRPLRVIRNL
jgi:pyruvate kinase